VTKPTSRRKKRARIIFIDLFRVHREVRARRASACKDGQFQFHSL
jgi:hypothetical protein